MAPEMAHVRIEKTFITGICNLTEGRLISDKYPVIVRDQDSALGKRNHFRPIAFHSHDKGKTTLGANTNTDSG